jgi:hypothetical protein
MKKKKKVIVKQRKLKSGQEARHEDELADWPSVAPCIVQWLRLAQQSMSHPHLRTETDSVSETRFLVFFRTPNDGQSPEKQ